jgi:hypothetical protein
MALIFLEPERRKLIATSVPPGLNPLPGLPSASRQG